MKVYEAVAAGIVAEGTTQVFGLLGDGNMSLWAALAKSGKVTLLSSGNEAGAVAMADGWWRATGQVGVATITHGPGLTQVGTSLTCAARNRTPLVLVIGQVRRGARHATQRMDQRPFVESCGARFADVTSPENLAEEMAEAFYAARLHRVPVVLNLDVALQERSFDWDFTYQPSTAFLSPLPGAASDEAIAPIVDKLAQAQRPVIIAGLGAMQSGARAQILRLGERVGALLATTLPAKGYFSGEEFDVGISGSFSSAVTEELLAEADFVLGVGAEIGYYTSEGGMMFPQADIARIDIAPQRLEIGVLPGLYACGDATLTVARIEEALAGRGVAQAGWRTEDTRVKLTEPGHAFEKAGDGLDPRQLARDIGAALPKGCLVTCGCCHFFAFPAMYMPLPKDAQMRFSYQFGAIGQTLPLAIGIGAASPAHPHVILEGDGAMLMNIQELFTVGRFGLDLVVIVWNDGGFGAEVHKMRAKGHDATLAQWPSADYVAVARGFGGDGVRVEREGEIAEAIRQGIAQGGLFVIDARVSPSTVSDPYLKLQFGQVNRAPLLRPASGVRA